MGDIAAPESLNDFRTLPWLRAAERARSHPLAAILGLAAVAAFVLAMTLPFIGQALHVDDAIFWDFARNNLQNPLQQHLPDYHLLGEDVAAFRDTHPPLTELFLSLIMWVTGNPDAEAPLHLGFVVFPLLAGGSMFFLARRFTRNALLVTLLMLATPAVMLLSHTLMGDMPMTAFWLAATAAYIYGVDRDDWRLLATAGCLATAAVFTGYQSLALILLLPAYAALGGKLSWRTVAPVVLPLLAFGAFAWFNLARYGALPRFSHARGLSMAEDDVLTRFEGMLMHIGGASVFPLFLAGGFLLRRKRYWLLPLLVAGSVAVSQLRAPGTGYPLSSTILFTVFFFAGCCLVLALASEGAIQVSRLLRRLAFDRDFLFLAGWLASMMIAVALLLPHATAKYYLPFFAPIILLLFREAERAMVSRRLLRSLGIAAIVLTCGIGIMLSLADYQLAAAYKDYALSFDPQAVAQAAGAQNATAPGNVWFVGEWGFRHYMESRGFLYLTSTSTAPQAGDLIVRPEMMDWPLADSLKARMKLVDVSGPKWDFPVRVMNMEAGAGFYGTYWGQLPFSFTGAPLDRFDVYQVQPA